MKKQLMIISVLFCTLLTGINSYAEDTPVSVSFGVNIQPAHWEGDNENGGTSFKADSSQLQLNLRIRKEKFYGGLGFQGAKFDFENGAPNKVYEINSSQLVLADDTATVERGEFDLVFGYYFWPQISLFLDLKNITNKWKGDDYALKYSGLGLGVSGFNPINADWTFFGSLGFVGLNIKTDNTKVGDGKGSALVLGVLYKITDHNHFTISLKSQHNEYEFDGGSKQTHDLGGLVFGFSHSI